MEYEPVEQSRSEAGSVVDSPNKGDVRKVIFQNEGRTGCLIEWETEDKECWIVAGRKEGFVSLDSAL